RVRQGLQAVPERAQAAAPRAPAERDLCPALHDGIRGRRGAARAAAGVLRRHRRVVVRRLSPRRRRRLAGDRDDAEARAAGGASGEVPRRQCAPALQALAAPHDHPRARVRDRAPRLVADRRGGARIAPARSVGHTAVGRRRVDRDAMATREFAVFDGDSHVVEPPDVWDRYLAPEYRTLGKHALWRQEGRTGSYLKVNGEIFRDRSNPNLPRHALWRPGMDWDVVGALDPQVRDKATEGAAGPPARLTDMDGMGGDQALLY